MTTYVVIENQNGKRASIEAPEEYEDVYQFLEDKYPMLYDLTVIDVSREIIGYEIFNENQAYAFLDE